MVLVILKKMMLVLSDPWGIVNIKKSRAFQAVRIDMSGDGDADHSPDFEKPYPRTTTCSLVSSLSTSTYVFAGLLLPEELPLRPCYVVHRRT